MELPFIIVFEPPSRSELWTVIRLRGTWVAGFTVALAIGTALVLTTVGHANQSSQQLLAAVDLTSHPRDADVWLDGQAVGRSPLSVQVKPGPHSVAFKAGAVVDTTYALQADTQSPARLDALLWRRQPTVTRLRPSLPGAVLSDVRWLADGQLALSVAVPIKHQLGAWRFEPRSGALTPLFDAASGERVVMAPDGQHVAYSGFDVGPPAVTMGGDPTPHVIWLGAVGGMDRALGWRVPLAFDEQVRDVSWSPLADRLLVVGGAAPGNATTHSRVWLLDAATLEGRELINLPSEVVSGSAVWSPDATRVAFLAHAGVLNALCMLDLTGGFRYLADLEPTTSQPLSYPVGVWSADGERLAFVAPRQGPPGTAVGWLQPEQRQTVSVATTTDVPPVTLGDTDVDRVAWREDGQLVGTRRSASDAALELRLITASAGSARLVDLPVRPNSGYTVNWDLTHGRLVLANPTPAGEVEYWLALLALADQP